MSTLYITVLTLFAEIILSCNIIFEFQGYWEALSCMLIKFATINAPEKKMGRGGWSIYNCSWIKLFGEIILSYKITYKIILFVFQGYLAGRILVVQFKICHNECPRKNGRGCVSHHPKPLTYLRPKIYDFPYPI